MKSDQKSDLIGRFWDFFFFLFYFLIQQLFILTFETGFPEYCILLLH